MDNRIMKSSKHGQNSTKFVYGNVHRHCSVEISSWAHRDEWGDLVSNIFQSNETNYVELRLWATGPTSVGPWVRIIGTTAGRKVENNFKRPGEAQLKN